MIWDALLPIARRTLSHFNVEKAINSRNQLMNLSILTGFLQLHKYELNIKKAFNWAISLLTVPIWVTFAVILTWHECILCIDDVKVSLVGVSDALPDSEIIPFVCISIPSQHERLQSKRNREVHIIRCRANLKTDWSQQRIDIKLKPIGIVIHGWLIYSLIATHSVVLSVTVAEVVVNKKTEQNYL